MKERSGHPGLTYLFLDEIQRLDRWELYIKKYYDLKYPVRFVLSGSASSPIFKKSRESLLGRVKDYHLPPFSFREFLLCRWRDRPESRRALDEIRGYGSFVETLFSGEPVAHLLPPLSQLPKAWSDIGQAGEVLRLPLPLFLLMFD